MFGSYLARTYPRPVVWVFRVGLKHSAWTDIRIYAPERGANTAHTLRSTYPTKPVAVLETHAPRAAWESVGAQRGVRRGVRRDVPGM